MLNHENIEHLLERITSPILGQNKLRKTIFSGASDAARMDSGEPDMANNSLSWALFWRLKKTFLCITDLGSGCAKRLKR